MGCNNYYTVYIKPKTTLQKCTHHPNPDSVLVTVQFENFFNIKISNKTVILWQFNLQSHIRRSNDSTTLFSLSWWTTSRQSPAAVTCAYDVRRCLVHDPQWWRCDVHSAPYHSASQWHSSCLTTMQIPPHCNRPAGQSYIKPIHDRTQSKFHEFYEHYTQLATLAWKFHWNKNFIKIFTLKFFKNFTMWNFAKL